MRVRDGAHRALNFLCGKWPMSTSYYYSLINNVLIFFFFCIIKGIHVHYGEGPDYSAIDAGKAVQRFSVDNEAAQTEKWGSALWEEETGPADQLGMFLAGRDSSVAGTRSPGALDTMPVLLDKSTAFKVRVGFL